jgi:transcriptional regulator with XRE-family HTH domain
MPSPEDKPYEPFDSFDEFFEQAEKRPEYWIEGAKLEFTREVLAEMRSSGVSKGELASRLGVQPGMVTRLLSGNNNFELATMVRIARALNCQFRCHLQSGGTKALPSSTKSNGKSFDEPAYTTVPPTIEVLNDSPDPSPDPKAEEERKGKMKKKG